MAYASDTKHFKNDMQDTARPAANTASDTAVNLANKAGAKIDSMLQSAESSATAIAGQGREAGQRVQEVAGNVKTAVDKSLRDQPMATLAVAAAMGFVVGALWKS
jgi:ElaB/YqjD/DUF883 family membrane-anchored ribosome-binding protein